MAANLIVVTAWNNGLNASGAMGKTTKTIAINTKNIVSVQTRATAYQTTGVTDIVYEVPVNNSKIQAVLVVTETQAAVVTAANASTTPA